MKPSTAPACRAPRLRLAVALALAAACSDASITAPSDAEASVSGSVTSAKTSKGVANLVVALLHDGRVVRAAPTDSAGGFEFRGVPSGAYALRVTGLELAGVSARFTSFDPAESPVQLTGGSAPTVFIAAVGLIPPRVVGVVRCAGVPVAGARVRVIGGSTDLVATTNDQGKYAATDLETGHYAAIVDAAPCTVAPGYRTANLLAGQMAELNFEG